MKNREEIAAYNKGYYAENREKIIANRKVYYAENRTGIAAKSKVYREENREKIADRDRFYKYGVTSDAFKSLLAKQGGKCAVCGDLGGKKGFCVDHDHESKKVRGLLCQDCNLAIGLLKDSSHVTCRATGYLKKHGK